MRTLESFSDADFRRTILRAIRLLLVLTLVALPFCWWRFGGWRGAAMLAVGAAISASGLWEWLRLLTAVMARMDAETPIRVPLPIPEERDATPVSADAAVAETDTYTVEGEAREKPAKVGGMGALLTGFFLRLAVVVLVLYGSLKYLEGSVVALAAGLGLGVFSLTVEGLRLVKAWTV